MSAFILISGCSLSQPFYPTSTSTIQQLPTIAFDCRSSFSPWDNNWLPNDQDIVSERIDQIITGTGLSELGNTILQYAFDYQVNPAFALAMFRKEASFAAPGTRAIKNNNPGNIIATGDCRGKPAGTLCIGVYGETSTDGRFGIYPDMGSGIRAYFTLLHQEYAPGTNRNCNDISCIVQAYCPPSDCNTQNYIDQITEWGKDFQCQLEGFQNPIIVAQQESSQAIDVTIEAATITPQKTYKVPALTNNATPQDRWPDSLIGTWGGTITYSMAFRPEELGQIILEIRRKPDGRLYIIQDKFPDIEQGLYQKYPGSEDENLYYCFDVFSTISGDRYVTGDRCFKLINDDQLSFIGGNYDIFMEGTLSRVK